MTWFERGQLSRRGLLKGTLVATSFALSASASQRLAGGSEGQQSRNTPFHERSSLAVATFFSPAWTQQFTAAFPVWYAFDARKERSTLKADWDERLFSVRDVAVGVAGGLSYELVVRREGAQAIIVDVPPHVSGIAFQVDVINNYPTENLASVRDSRLSLHDGSGQVLEEWRDVPLGADCTPWSVEATVNWICRQGHIIPARILVESIGPGPVPAGTVIRAEYADAVPAPLLVDPSSPEALNPKAVDALDETERQPVLAVLDTRVVDGRCELTLTTTDALSAGKSLELLFEHQASDSEPLPFGDFVPRMHLVTPRQAPGLRKSGRHSDFPVSSSGAQRSSYRPEPTA